MNKRLGFLMLISLVFHGQIRLNGQLPVKDLYLGEALPGNTPVLFAPGRISDGLSNRDMAISPAGDELFYTIQSPSGQISTIVYLHYTEGAWSKPEIASFAGKYCDLEPAFSSDGQTLFFASNRPVRTEDTAIKDYDIWMVKKEKGKWREPARLDTVINSSKDEFYPSVARNGNLYFTREMENGKGKEDIVVSEWKKDSYQKACSLSEAINTENYEFNAFVDPDEQFLLFSSFGRKDDLGEGDLYLSRKNGQGEWMKAVHLDLPVNSKNLDFCPFVSPDKKFLFFTSNRMKTTPPFKKALDLKSLRALLEGPGNGFNDIYWMEWKN